MDQPGTRIQWGQALVVLSMIGLSWWTATQWTAWELAFQPELGRPWFTILHRWPVYAPPLFFWWWYEFDAYAPAVFARGAWIAGSGGVLAFAAAVALSVHRAREAKRAATDGSARGAEDARELLNKSDNERSGVLSTAMSFLGLYRDPVVATVTSRCEWRIGDLLEGNQPVSLYFVIPPSDISRTKPLIRLILNQIGRRLTEDLSGRKGRRRLLLMLDEFPALGRAGRKGRGPEQCPAASWFRLGGVRRGAARPGHAVSGERFPGYRQSDGRSGASGTVRG
ncbi:Conjugal transfer protein TraG [Komagataeibacter saccharivorans]|uniref:Conjugal transfer protein TraG n=1 Tax=Komagataeibacter saccharivorans TaxID=265959 RepID=A0A347W7P4_9PROT|nr:Conjugal transfer protein TraG [Komagataeibacter saccharivorans]